MKKKIEAELVSIAHRILQLKDHTTLPQLQEEVRQLYEKLTILNFTEQHFAGPQPTIGQVKVALEMFPSPSPATEVQEKVKTMIEEEKEIELPIALQSIELEKENQEQDSVSVVEEIPLPEESEKGIKETVLQIAPETEEIKTPDKPEFIIDEVNASISEDMFVPATAEQINAILRGEEVTEPEVITGQTFQKNDKEEITPKAPEPTPRKESQEDDRPKSLNDRLKKNINIGLNDRLAFIKHLFNGSSADYNRVLSQLNTVATSEEALEFINERVKPDHNNWQGKEEYEERFLEIVGSRFD